MSEKRLRAEHTHCSRPQPHWQFLLSGCPRSQNFSDGLTLVSGSHMVEFGGTIATNNNLTHGISLNSKAGLDLDAGSQVTTTGNSGDAVHVERSS